MQDGAQSVESAGYTLNSTQFELFRQLVRNKAGISLRDDKQLLVCSRLSKRLRALQLPNFDEYLMRLRREGEGGAELEKMLNAITTNKTNFYREAHHFEQLVELGIAPRLHAAHGSGFPLRIWSAACSTGEEVYTTLITLLDAVPQWERCDIRCLASDIDTDVLAVGERGVYDEDALSGVPSSARSRWFIEGTGDKRGQVRVRRPLRERVAFRRINFIDAEWPVRTRFDAIFCRNALIYFDAPMQRAIVARLLPYLRKGGLLFLGHSESMAGVRPDLKSHGRTCYEYLGGEP